jgi:hypothetical protein
MWIRGGDSANGDTSLPDFPIGRDRTQYKKARLMTPIDTSGTTFFNNLANATSANITNERIPNGLASPNGMGNYNANGNYLWFWVTWRINIQYTYIDPVCGQLPGSDSVLQAPEYYKDLYMAYVPFKEHYPLIRGRTTVIEPRQVYGVLIDGNNGQLSFGSVSAAPARRD